MDYTWKRMNRRQGVVKRVILPAMISPIPKVAIVVDTSGSMGEDGSAVLSEIAGILKACGSRSLKVYSCDAQVHSAKRVFTAGQVELIGGGGTNMGVGIAAAEREKHHVIVVLTDGYTPWPVVPPSARIIVALVNSSEDTQGPDYARTIRCDPKQRSQP
jgi:predicted metal-dependent peptidase